MGFCKLRFVPMMYQFFCQIGKIVTAIAFICVTVTIIGTSHKALTSILTMLEETCSMQR